MREIKFRVWDNETKKFWHEGRNLSLVSLVADNLVNDDSTVLEQYTNMTDKNGVEIYEGDIVKTETSMVQTVVGITPIYIYEDTYTLVQATKSLSDEIFVLDNSDVVIGNIHENPELLEVD
ncbi:hypothetical protein KGP39_07265 [Weissella hellenica]|nr:hypothetical protein [Weissella hellenica]